MATLRKRSSGWSLLAWNAGLVFLLLALSESLIAQQPLSGGFTNIDPPGAVVAAAWGINNAGVIVGRYKPTTSGPYHAFLRDENGSYSNIDPPNAIWAEAKGVNNRGDVVGYFCDTAPCGSISTYQGFLLREGVYSSFGSPNHTNTWAIRINEAGRIVGCDHDTDTMGTMHGFVDSGGNFADFPLPASMHNGLSPDGKTIVGLYTDLVTMQGHGYVLREGNFMPFDVPGASLTNAWDINAQGEIVGVHLDANGKFHGFLRNGARYFSIDYPNAIATFAFGTNETGQIVGQYRDAGGVAHAFLLTRHEED